MASSEPGRGRRQGASGFDRISRPDPVRPRDRDGQGKEALYSTSPSAGPTSQVELRCRRCQVPFGLSMLGVLKLLKPPFLWDPIRDLLWTRCPACDQRSWIEVRKGQALRALLDRRP